ncbi:transporter substrate-binding domain-containing protein [Acinetobacter calcoaceticus]|uniref:transporter substrate-binding domain-containing protein n=1 Tax=Acinetobacter calcoaceticus TaxID=471 RepID=UPI00192C4E24|nr:transporter substrate-binding domain-containing protein [Acinetobacter calcoaceticus]
MPKLGVLVSIICYFSCSGLQAESAQSMKVFSRETLPQIKFELEDSDWRWLGKKREINIAVYAPDKPPFELASEPGVWEGISADYSLLLAHSLGLRIKVLRYSDRKAALDGLQKGHADMLVDYDNRNNQLANFVASQPFSPSYTALVKHETGLTPALEKSSNVRIAVEQGYLSDKWAAEHFPKAKITRYDLASNALSSVAFGENDYFIGNLTEASFLVERNYANLLTITDVLETAEATGPYFLLRKDEIGLQRAVNKVLDSVSLVQHKAITSGWSQGEALWKSQPSFTLTEKERRWLANNNELRVVINPLYAPFTMFDANGQFYGIGADILRLIHLRTGLKFNVIESDSVTDMFQMVDQNKADFIAAMSYSDERDKQLIFTRPYVQPPFVLIVNNNITTPISLSDIKSLAITSDNPLWSWLKSTHPHIKLVKADSASLAMQWVKEKKVDGAVHNLIGANYMIDHFFRGELKIAARIGDSPSQMAFAVRRDHPELYSILNKALADISPRDISMIANKWQGTPDVKLDTWSVYRKEFYWLAGIFAALVLTSLFWIYYLRREVNRRKEMQKQLQAQVVFRETLFNSMLVPVYVVDQAGNILSHNLAWENFFKLDMVYLDKLALTSSLHPLASVYSTLREIFNNPEEHASLKLRYSINNGEETRIIVHQAVPYTDINGSVVGLICSWQDITDHEYLLTELSSAREKAEVANRTKSTFLATMSHEIRTPISAIVGLLELTVTNKTFTQTDMDAIRVAYESAQSLMGLVGEILDMAKIESGELELVPKWARFDELIMPVVRVFDGLARQKNLTLYSHIDALHPDEIYIDPLRLHQVLSNLISNAIKFTKQGSVAVEVKCLCKKDQHTLLELIITDTGVGIAEEDQQQIFKPYKQSDAGKMQTGTGLGLAICTQLVKMMGGVINLHSQLGKGTQITVHIPVEHRQSIQTAVEPISAIPVSKQPLHILAVDDHPANRLLLKSQLTRLGHFVLEAENGEHALQLWRSNNIDLVITDCNMPIMDGLTLTHLLRQERTRPVTIFGLTANAQPEERARCLAAGMDDCLFKPLQLAQLEQLLNKVIRPTSQGLPQKNSLEQWVDLTALRKLAHDNVELLQQLLLTTRDENIKDMHQARLFMEQQDCAALTRCFHRMAGAAQILGAIDVEKPCHELEHYCESTPNFDELGVKIDNVMNIVTAFNSAIDEFIRAKNR